ncbi:hypothetical protein BCR37DRAFT_388737 [Protomyces lactucae-debilis]|uniref:Hexosyltransferase n=1 Tax=Protomyces lactucae-debilis TaxID=2754530 RepID=A0A1Y2F3U5_PROLT|nr:uncharacterized protein BCR37DRAFT_388737 [Protomyces lactucae-debilis]ORY78542.1 hypothetical protein BCR37DRAFT_388737 [Protomyces lactucae-debilis]
MKLRSKLVCFTFIALLLYLMLSGSQTLTRSASSAVSHGSDRGGNEPSAHHLKAKTTPVSVFIGIFSTPERSDRRQLLRNVYSRVRRTGLSQSQDTLVFKHIIARPDSNVSSDALAAEQAEHNDLLFLDCNEGAEGGKTWYYFAALGKKPHIADHVEGYDDPQTKFDFVMKLDDDTYLNLPRFLDAIRLFQGTPEVYFGRICNLPIMPSGFHHFPYHCGLGYALSTDLCQWLSETYDESPPIKYLSAEDVETAGWLRDGGKLFGFAAIPQSQMYSFWDRMPAHLRHKDWYQKMTPENMQYTVDHLNKRDIAIHGLKDEEFMIAVADWFHQLERQMQ